MKLRLFAAFVVALAVGVNARPADAAAILVLDDTSTAGLDVVVMDGALAGSATSLPGLTTSDDLNPVTGAVTFIGSAGSFSVNVTTGLTKPVIGSSYTAQIDLNFVTVSGAAGPSTLVMYFLDTDFLVTNQAALPLQLTGDVGGTAAGTVDWIGCIDPTNSGAVTGGYCVGASGLLGPGAFSDSATGAFGPIGSSPFQLLAGIAVNHTAAGQSSSGDLQVTAVVPEPGSLMLLGGGLLGLAGIARRRARRARRS